MHLCSTKYWIPRTRFAKGGVSKGSNIDATFGIPITKYVGTITSFMGSVQLYAKFRPPNLSTTTEPLHKLTREGAQWNCGRKEQETFERLKDLLCTEKVLAYYDPFLESGISCHVSEVGISAVLLLLLYISQRESNCQCLKDTDWYTA